jgi:sulfite exporter TauE/SafE
MDAGTRVQRGKRLLKIGLLWHLIGCGPLYAVLLLSKLGIGDPDPNPVFLGIVAGLSILPSLIVMGIGVNLTRQSERE